MRVVLPAPLGPTTATASPASTRNYTSHNAVKCPYPAVTFLSSSTGAPESLT